MKKIITLLTLIFNITILSAQDDCETYIDFMTEAVEQRNIDKAKADMKAFIACKMENNANLVQLNLLNQLVYFSKFENDLAIAKNELDEYLIINKSFKIIKNLKLKYEVIGEFKEGMAYVIKNKKMGFINNAGFEIIPLIYDYDIDFFFNGYSNGVCKVQKDNTFYYINKKNERVSNLYDEIYDYSFSSNDRLKELNIVEKDNKYGFIDYEGKEIIPLKYEKVERFKKGLSAVKLNKKWGYINETGNFLIEPQFDEAKSFNENVAAALKNKKWYFIDTTGTFLNSSGFDNVMDFTNGFAPVLSKDKWGLINKIMNWVIPAEYDSIEIFNNLFLVKKYNEFGFIDQNLKIYLFDKIEKFTETRNSDFLKIFIDQNIGLFDIKHNKQITFPGYTDIKFEEYPYGNVNEFVFILKNKKGESFYDYKRNLTSIVYNKIETIKSHNKESLHLILEINTNDNIFFGMYNLKNGKLIESKFKSIYSEGYYQNQVFRVFKETDEHFINECIYLDENYNIIFSENGTGWDFNNGLALYCNNTKDPCYFINKNGKKLFSLANFENSTYYTLKNKGFNEGRYIVFKYDKCGYIDTNGNQVTPLNYNECQDFEKGISRVKVDKLYFYINKKGECVKDCENAPADHPRASN